MNWTRLTSFVKYCSCCSSLYLLLDWKSLRRYSYVMGTFVHVGKQQRWQKVTRRHSFHRPITRHQFPTSLPERAAGPSTQSSPVVMPVCPRAHTSPSPLSTPHAPSLSPPPVSPLSSHRSKVNCGAFVWCLSSSEPKDEDESVNKPSFKLRTASFNDVP